MPYVSINNILLFSWQFWKIDKGFLIPNVILPQNLYELNFSIFVTPFRNKLIIVYYSIVYLV